MIQPTPELFAPKIKISTTYAYEINKTNERYITLHITLRHIIVILRYRKTMSETDKDKEF